MNNYTTSLSADVFFAILDALPDDVAPPDVACIMFNVLMSYYSGAEDADTREQIVALVAQAVETVADAPEQFSVVHRH